MQGEYVRQHLQLFEYLDLALKQDFIDVVF